jgi:hypothetical protein
LSAEATALVSSSEKRGKHLGGAVDSFLSKLLPLAFTLAHARHVADIRCRSRGCRLSAHAPRAVRAIGTVMLAVKRVCAAPLPPARLPK